MDGSPRAGRQARGPEGEAVTLGGARVPTARGALVGGARALLEAPVPTAIALAGGTLSAVILEAASAAAERVSGVGGHAGAALALWVLGGSIAALVLGASLAG